MLQNQQPSLLSKKKLAFDVPGLGFVGKVIELSAKLVDCWAAWHILAWVWHIVAPRSKGPGMSVFSVFSGDDGLHGPLRTVP